MVICQSMTSPTKTSFASPQAICLAQVSLCVKNFILTRVGYTRFCFIHNSELGHHLSEWLVDYMLELQQLTPQATLRYLLLLPG